MKMVWSGVVALLAVTAPVSASLIEENTGIHLQNDGGSQHDAADSCADLNAQLHQVDIAEFDPTEGVLIPGDDEADFYQLNTQNTTIGSRVKVRINAAGFNLADLEIDVQLPGCGGSVFDPATFEQQREALQTSPDNAETTPPGPGEKTVAAHQLTGYTCDPTQWHFVVNQLGPGVSAPVIRVKWSNGEVEDIAGTKSTPATVAHYHSTLNLDQPVWSANMNVFMAWDGRFNLGSGPCNGPATAPPDPFVDPFTQGFSGEFTVVYPQPYVVAAIYKGQGDPPTSIPLSCHEICGGAVGDAMGAGFGYDLLGQPQQEDA